MTCSSQAFVLIEILSAKPKFTCHINSAEISKEHLKCRLEAKPWKNDPHYTFKVLTLRVEVYVLQKCPQNTFILCFMLEPITVAYG